MYVYTVYINKKMVFSSTDIKKIFNYIHTQYDKKKLETFNVEYFGNNYVTKYSHDNVEIFIVREKCGYIKDNLNKLRDTSETKCSRYVKLDKIANHDDVKSYTPNTSADNYDVTTIRIGNDNKLYIVENSDNGKKWKMK